MFPSLRVCADGCASPIDANNSFVDGISAESLCNGHGRCETSSHGLHCVCYTGYTGSFCELSKYMYIIIIAIIAAAKIYINANPVA